MNEKLKAKEKLKQEALDYHAKGRPGKIAVQPTKPCETQAELSLAYTPGVAAPVRAIAEHPELVYKYTGKSNLVAVISDGTAVLGLGNTGPLASKPVMEGKAVLFKQFADIDVFDIEVQAASSAELIQTVINIAPTFGGINLEDIAAPACFEVEAALVEKLDIPVFHDDQHGTAIIVAAGMLNALEIQGKTLQDARIVCLGAGAAGIASLRLLLSLGARKENLFLMDRQGVVHSHRQDLNVYKQEFSLDTPLRTLAEVMDGADVFLGLSGPNLLPAELLGTMAPKPVVFALSNPDPEIDYHLAKATRDDLIIATGRSDFPNQVNNVLGFPFIFRGALDVRARLINEAMKVAAVKALAKLAHEPVPAEVLQAYQLDALEFGPDYIIPKPFDARLQDYVPPAVAQAAVDSGAASVYPAQYPPAPQC
ncbi:MAG: malate dehydrogenase [Gammaproteobacteria bacterium]|nr:malate dehydrogenase [Gammaproteobacteria bacterium]MDH5799938.1 malate dehydrogenase [Gammaproteobacteria bacterium]